jgi:hypothetical protein
MAGAVYLSIKKTVPNLGTAFTVYITFLIYKHDSGGQGEQGGQQFASLGQTLASEHFFVHSILAFFLAFFLPPFAARAGEAIKVTASIATSNFFIF